MKLVLATNSQFRIGIYKKLGFDIDAISSEEVEYYSDRHDPIKYVQELSKIKAYSVAKKIGTGIIIGCDTIAVIDNIILEKPKDKEEAKKNMQLLQGRQSFAISGVTIIDASKNVSKTFSEITKVLDTFLEA